MNCRKLNVEKFEFTPEYQEAMDEIKLIMEDQIKDYADYFHLLLWFDEAAQSIMLRKYNMSNVIFFLNSYFFIINYHLLLG